MARKIITILIALFVILFCNTASAQQQFQQRISPQGACVSQELRMVILPQGGYACVPVARNQQATQQRTQPQRRMNQPNPQQGQIVDGFLSPTIQPQYMQSQQRPHRHHRGGHGQLRVQRSQQASSMM